MADAGKQPQDAAKARLDAIALAEQAEAEAAEADALAVAARARARAIQLRRAAEAHADDEADTTTELDETAEVTDPEVTDSEVADAADATPEASVSSDAETPEDPAAPPTKTRLRISMSVLLVASTIVTICALLGASGWMAWRHHYAVKERQDSAAFVSAARQGIINLTSLDFNKSKEDVQRIVDSATGDFKDQFQKTADDFASVVKDTKAVAEGSVAAAAVESMSKDSAVVLVLANERVTNAAGAKDQPRTFRFRVSVVRDGDQLKLSKVEFVL